MEPVLQADLVRLKLLVELLVNTFTGVLAGVIGLLAAIADALLSRMLVILNAPGHVGVGILFKKRYVGYALAVFIVGLTDVELGVKLPHQLDRLRLIT